MGKYSDYLSDWYISQNDKHSTFINQIKDEDLKNQVDTVIDSKKLDSNFDTRFDFDVCDTTDEGELLATTHNEQFSVWYDDDIKNCKLYRLTPGKNVEKGTIQKSSGSSSGSGFKNTGERGYFDSKSKKLVTWEEWEEFANDYSMRLLTPKDVSPTCFLLQKNGKEILKVWIGKWIKPST